MKAMKDPFDLHVFKRFRNNNLNNYGLCPSHYLSAPALGWMQSLIWQKWYYNLPQILTCTYSLQKVITGGVSYIFNRYGKARNKYLISYDSKQVSKHVIYLDTNNL